MAEDEDAESLLIFEDTHHPAGGSAWRAVRIIEGARLRIEGQDLGGVVEQVFGHYEYEFFRTLSESETARVAELLGAGSIRELLPAIEQRFNSCSTLESFLSGHGISGEFWNRIGD